MRVRAGSAHLCSRDNGCIREEETDRSDIVEEDYSKSSEDSSTCEGVLFSRRNKKGRAITDSDDEVSLDSSYNYNP